MTEAQANSLSIRISQIMDRWDPWGYADTLADFDNNEELVLEYQAKALQEHPAMVIDSLLETMECMLEKLELDM